MPHVHMSEEDHLRRLLDALEGKMEELRTRNYDLEEINTKLIDALRLAGERLNWYCNREDLTSDSIEAQLRAEKTGLITSLVVNTLDEAESMHTDEEGGR